MKIKDIYERIGELLKDTPEAANMEFAACGASSHLNIFYANGPAAGVTGISLEDHDYMDSFIEIADKIIADYGKPVSMKTREHLITFQITNEGMEESDVMAELEKCQKEHPLSRIERIREYKKISESQSENKTKEEWASLVEEISKLESRISDLVHTATGCIVGGISIKDFMADSVSHQIGFAQAVEESDILGYKNWLINRMGINGCGVSGDFNFRTNGTQSVFVNRVTRQILAPHTDVMRSFIDGFDAFEKKFYDYVDGVLDEKLK